MDDKNKLPRPANFLCLQVSTYRVSIRYKLTCSPIKDLDQYAHERYLIHPFDGRSKGSQGSNVSSVGKLRLSIEIEGGN